MTAKWPGGDEPARQTSSAPSGGGGDSGAIIGHRAQPAFMRAQALAKLVGTVAPR